jgi:hypothetical protein
MSHRFTTWWRALSVVLLSLATVTWPSAARAAATPQFTVVHQSALATLSSGGTGRFATTLHLSTRTAARVRITIYPVLFARSQLDSIAQGIGTSAKPLSTTSFSLRCERHGDATFSVTIYTRTLKSVAKPCAGVTPRLRLPCTGTRCDGVYPLRYSVDVAGVELTKWSLLALRTTSNTQPLQVALVESITRSTLNHPKRSVGVLNTISHLATTPLTLSANYQLLSVLEGAKSSDMSLRLALTKALSSPLHRIVDAPPSNVDFAGLVANRLTTQVPQQLTLTENLLTSLTGRYVDGPLVVSGPTSPASLSALAGAGINNVVLPESDLSSAPSNSLAWGAPFHVVGAGSLTVLSTDGPLKDFFSNAAIEPGRRAAMAVATLAFLHYQQPNAPVRRTVVVQSSVGSLSKTFMSDLINALSGDPLSHLTTLSPLFNSSLIGTDGAPSTRSLATTTQPSTWTSRNVSSLLSLIGAANSFSLGVKSGNVATQLHVAVARAEIFATPNQRQNAITLANNQLNAQLGQFAIDASAITLAGQGTSMPITVTSRAPYHYVAVVHLITDRLSFPKGRAVPITMNSPTQSIRVPTADPRGSSLTLQVELTTPNGQLVLAHSAVQVRIAGTSVVGYLLTFASLFVLALWWWRTNRRRSKGRHAR